MVVLAASICTKNGKAVISRQFREMSRTRIESLLSSFPKLIPTGTQHTSVETSEVRYVYQPLEDLYILLITNKASNILQDIETLHLFARVIADMVRVPDEREISRHAFDLLGAFDEIVSMGYKENVNLSQVRSVLEMESHEEKIQDIIARNKEAEAKEELKRRAKQLELQRREQQRRNPGGSGMGMGMGSGYGGMGGGITGYSPVSRFDAPEPAARTISQTNNNSASTPARTPTFKGSGMKLGAKKTKQAELLDALGGDVLASTSGTASPAEVPASPAANVPPVPQYAKKDERGSLPEIQRESVHIVINEQISATLEREGGVSSMELRGDMNLQISDSTYSRVKVMLTKDFNAKNMTLKQHPNVAKFAPGTERVIALKDSNRGFPVNQSIAVLRWRYSGTDESLIPLSINCWPTPSNDGTTEVSIEYELETPNLTLYDTVISIPLPDGSYPTVSSHTGDWQLDPSSHSLAWSVPVISSDDDDTQSGSLVFTVGGDDPSAFFPVDVTFIAKGTLSGMGVESVSLIDGGNPVYSVDARVSADGYTVL